MNSSTPAIDIQNLAYSYRKAEAAHDLSLRVLPGRCYGLFGRNGAGKTHDEVPAESPAFPARPGARLRPRSG